MLRSVAVQWLRGLYKTQEATVTDGHVGRRQVTYIGERVESRLSDPAAAPERPAFDDRRVVMHEVSPFQTLETNC